MWANLGQTWPKSWRNSAGVVNIENILAQISPSLANLCQISPNFRDLHVRNLPPTCHHAVHLPWRICNLTLTDVDQRRRRFGQTRPGNRKHRLHLAKVWATFGPMLAELGPKLALLWPRSAQRADRTCRRRVMSGALQRPILAERKNANRQLEPTLANVSACRSMWV